MKKIQVLLLFIFLMILSSMAWAAAPVTLQDCYRESLKRSEPVLLQKETVTQAEEHYQQVLGAILPNLSGTASYFRQEGPAGSVAATFSPEQSLAKLTLAQPLFRGFREYAGLRQTEDFLAAQKAAYQWTGMLVYDDVVRGFYTVLMLQTDLEHLDAQIHLYDQRITDLQKRVAIGRSRPTEVLTVQAAKAILKAQREQAAGQLRVAQETFASLTGMPADSVLQDAKEPPQTLEAVDVYQATLDSRPDLLSAQQQLKATRENVPLEKGAHWPNLDFIGNYYPYRTGSLQNVTWDVMVGLTMPFYAGGAIVSKTREAESQVRQSETNLALQRRLDLLDLRTLYANVQSDLSQIAAYQEASDLSEKNYRAVLRDYNLGLVTNLDVLQAMTAYLDSVRSLDRTRYAVKIDHEHLETAGVRRLNLLGGF